MLKESSRKDSTIVKDPVASNEVETKWQTHNCILFLIEHVQSRREKLEYCSNKKYNNDKKIMYRYYNLLNDEMYYIIYEYNIRYTYK